MKINRLVDLEEYEAKGHFDMKGFRMQGFDASDTENFWVGLSYFLPGGGTTSGLRESLPSLRMMVRITSDQWILVIWRRMKDVRLLIALTKLLLFWSLCPIHQEISDGVYNGIESPVN